ncbi:hypothetical protein [Tropicimonas sediminicola]|uniref:4-amino-4-deoxy-L-arabinose transferase n=1 Tax=Tropicimonas sediminicola TaxID=1031541 RepID=A0A239KLJ7_9RHOB|nr:hypothetical protein [Tropicimonas sediminicola]SNT19267.1 hypothetical protein SAMN05421757_107222 [Tropicimonas sediminicola]
MSQAATLEGAARGRLRLPAVSLASVLLGFAALQIAAYLNAGVFEYPLDDVYIHLAVAEQIAAGGYGVNPGEYASAASSPLYPLLLVPLAGTEAQRFLPLAWNIAALAACGWLWGRILVQAGYEDLRRGTGLALAILVPLVINLPGLAFAGMEHSLHAAASLAVVFGLLVLLDEDRVSPLLILGILLGPAMRFEGLALSLLAAGVLMLRGRWLTGLASAAGALAIVGLFMWFLSSLGLDPLPSSVQAKLGNDELSNDLAGVIVGLIRAFEGHNIWIMIAALSATAAMPFAAPELRQSPRRWLLLVLFLALGAHAVAGKLGWMNRYEGYVLAAATAGLLALAARSGPLARFLAVLPVIAAGAVYAPHFVHHYPTATRTIDRQQAQMARFAKEFHREPVAVNDLGRVAWGNPDYVLDIWGLGSLAALDYRQNGGPEHWVDLLAQQHGVELAMIYDDWFGGDIGPDWVRLGQLELSGPWHYSAKPEVAFYATSPEAAGALRAKLEAWVPGLPEGARFIPQPEADQ